MNIMINSEEHEIKSHVVNNSYINSLKEEFNDISFECIEKIGNKYITSSDSENTSNDRRIFTETQAKRILRGYLAPFISKAIKEKLSYFSEEKDKDESRIYKRDSARNLQIGEKYAVQNIGHATQLIQITGFNILTDPVFGNLNALLYPAKTESHPSIQQLPQIHVIIISHNHRDHVDEYSLKILLEHYKTKGLSQPKVFVPVGDKQLFQGFGFNQVEEVEWYTKITVTKNIDEIKNTVNFISIPADHRSGRFFYDNHQSLVAGWVINPEQEDVIFKYSGDTRPLSDENQRAIDAVLLNEIKNKEINKANSDQDIEISNIICLEPSGPNYTRCDMDVTHQSTSYSALLKLIEAQNLAKLSGKGTEELLQKIQTVMMHHNKFELGPDRFNEGSFVMKKLLKYLDLNEEDLNKELVRQQIKLSQNLDEKKLKESTPFTSRPIISILPQQTSLLVHAKDFIIREIEQVIAKTEGIDKELIKKYLIENTVFPKIGERLTAKEVVNSRFDVQSVQKYTGKCESCSQ